MFYAVQYYTHYTIFLITKKKPTPPKKCWDVSWQWGLVYINAIYIHFIGKR